MRACCGNDLENTPEGYSSDRFTGAPLAETPRIPGPAQKLMGLRSVLAVTMEVEGHPTARILLANGKRRFTVRDLQATRAGGAARRAAAGKFIFVATLARAGD